MRVDQFDFDLPEERIALRPARPRDTARMLVVGGDGTIADRGVLDLPNELRPGDALVFNDTKVIPAELHGERRRGENTARIRVTLMKRLTAESWRILARPAKRLAPGDRLEFAGGPSAATLNGEVLEAPSGGETTIRFSVSGPNLDRAIAELGHIPLPPYIAGKRAETGDDRQDYQTMFAAHDGAVAAPTAGLHFTDRLVERLTDRGIGLHGVTLHVGAGTFLPVKADDTADHVMHAEWGEVSGATAEALNRVRRDGGRVVAIGTTSLRLLESAVGDDGVIHPFADETSIFLTPGSRFRAVDALMTNFHLPRSTLFMLVSAFSGLETMRRAYAHAIAAEYRFYSYGDACLLFPENAP